MNILLFKPEQRINELVHINNPQQIEHIQKILKLKAGDNLRVGELNGLLGKAVIQSFNPIQINKQQTQNIELKVELTTPPPQPLPCTLILALPRPQQLKRILVHVSSLGVKHLHLIQSERVEKNYWQSPKLKDIERYLIEGLEQAIDTVLPSVHLHKNYAEFMNNTLPVIKQNKNLWVAHPGNYSRPEKQETKMQSEEKKEQIIIIGPEGGFIDEEMEKFIKAGAKGVSLGSRILKVETAIPILLGAMLY